MTKHFCSLGLNNNIKPIILASIPDPLQVAVNQALQRQNKDILSLTAGKIQQEVSIALEDICNRKKIFKDYLHGDKRIDKACDDSYLKFKCPKDHSCACKAKKDILENLFSNEENTLELQENRSQNEAAEKSLFAIPTYFSESDSDFSSSSIYMMHAMQAQQDQQDQH
ncbi:hypothetical protein J1N35_007836 [Gossypium stocksii]|uniref:Uncharacterized protein n=1 Tax=Gossypium stocksii TaxID=47602 RepID=A0A9D3W869_9ROSI|nr:hypothetical protein J1N35_007836 [Gossypium stocksii]